MVSGVVCRNSGNDGKQTNMTMKLSESFYLVPVVNFKLACMNCIKCMKGLIIYEPDVQNITTGDFKMDGWILSAEWVKMSILTTRFHCEKQSKLHGIKLFEFVKFHHK